MSNFMYDLAHKAKNNSFPNKDYTVSNLEELISEYLECNDYFDTYVKSDRLKMYGIAEWYCTDSYVGTCAIFLDDELIAITYQEGRKCDTYYHFLSEPLCKKFLDFLKELRDKFKSEKDLINKMDILDLKTFEFLKDGYFQVDYVDQILGHIYRDAYIKVNDIYIKCDSFKRANKDYLCKDLIVVLNKKSYTKNLKEIYFKCNG